MSIQDALKASAPEKAVISRSAGMSGSGLFVKNPKSNVVNCENRDFTPLSYDVIRNHLIGNDPADRYRREFVIGLYPMLLDETCWFLAVDFDKETWKEDSRAYLETCETFNVPVVLERSRSGNGGHIWIFFSEPIPAKLARQLGAFMLTQAMESRPEKGGMGKKQRQAAFNALEYLPDRAEKALLATGRYLGEGFDDKRLDTLFLTLPISWRGTLSQYAGRLHRIHDSKKEVVIFDYVDFEVPVLARMFDRRIKGYRSIGYEIEDDQS